ncbi:MAG: GNAT family N-acetyltransferase [Alphaproteobacteria bacterium]|nr:GNAT family N-acetyltransferase [Alphaproteobacteria bacterium]
MAAIREAKDEDWPQIWPILQEAFATGDTYPYPADISEDDARHSWMTMPHLTAVADGESGIAGVYYLKPNMPGLGSHICNCGYIVAKAARGHGLGKALCTHSMDAARALGYRAMQFNLVVSTNENAVGLWQALGFEVIGTVPEGFNHATLGYVDALIMYQQL